MTFLLSQDREISYGTTKIQKKNLARHLKSPDFPFGNYCFLLVLYTVCYDFEKDFEWLSRFFF